MKVTQSFVTPFVALIIGKILGILFTSVVFSLDIGIGDIFSLFKLMIAFDEDEKLIHLSSYSDLFMFTILSTGLVASLFSQVNLTSQRLTKKDLELYFQGGIKNIFHTAMRLYGQSLFWFSFIIIASTYILYNVLTGKTYLWIYLITLLLTISLAMYFYYDFHKEVQLAKNKLFKNEL